MNALRECVFVELCDEIYKILSETDYGRTFQPSHSEIVKEDILFLIEKFKEFVPIDRLKQISRPLMVHISDMSKPTITILKEHQEGLISKNKAVKILCNRRADAAAMKFIDENY